MPWNWPQPPEGPGPCYTHQWASTSPRPPGPCSQLSGLAQSTSGLALAPGPSLTHQWVGTSPGIPWAQPYPALVRTQTTHQQADTSSETPAPATCHPLPWDPALPTSGPALAPEPLKLCSEVPCDPVLPTNGPAPGPELPGPV